MQVQSALPSIVRTLGLAAVAFGLTFNFGCAGKVENITIKKMITGGMEYQDIERLCTVGEVLGIPLATLGISENAMKAHILADVSAALCMESKVREAQLAGAYARKNLSGELKVNGVLDARYREERAHTAAAYRYKQAWDKLELEYGTIGAGECPKIKEKDELVYLMGLYAGIHGMLHDQAGGGHVGISFETLGKVARGTRCLDNDKWWHVPKAFKAAADATLLNTEDGDPWEALAAEADAGDKTGIRLARAVQVMILANADKIDGLREALAAHAKSMADNPADPAWAAMDQYAFDVSRHELDRLWMDETGHRAPAFDELPGLPVEEGDGADPFGSNPFGGDPFGGGDDAEDESTEDAGSDDDASQEAGEE